MRKFLLIVAVKLSIRVFSVTDYFTLKHCCQCKVRVYEVPPGPTGINPYDKMVRNTLVETSAYQVKMGDEGLCCVLTCSRRTKGCQS